MQRSVTAGTAVLVAGNVVPPLATFVMAPLLAHALGVGGRGELAAVTAPSLLAVAVATLGIPDAVTRSIAAGSRITTSAWWSTAALLVTSGCTALLVSLVVAPVVVGSDDPTLVGLVGLASAAVLPQLCIAVLRARAAGRRAWGLVTAERITSGGAKIAASVVLAATGTLDLVTATVVIAASPVLGGLVYLGRGRGVAVDSGSPVRPRALLGFSARSWLGSVAGIILVRVDQLLVLPLSDATQLGLYAVAVNISEVPLIATNAVREVMLSEDAGDQDDERAPRVARSAAVVATVIAAPLLVGAPFWLPVLFGGDFLPAIPALVVSVVAVVIGVPGSIAGSTLTARGRPELRSCSILAGCVVNVVALVLLVPLLGAVGAALATLAGNLTSSNGSVLGACRMTGRRFRDFTLVRPGDVGFVVSRVRTLIRPTRQGI